MRLWGATERASITALTALTANDLAGLSSELTTLAALLDDCRAAAINLYVTFFYSVLGRLLTAAGQTEQARNHLDAGLALAQDTGMHFYDAELLRLRAGTHADDKARHADLTAARELARRQGAALFELRAALDGYELRGTAARSSQRGGRPRARRRRGPGAEACEGSPAAIAAGWLRSTRRAESRRSRRIPSAR